MVSRTLSTIELTESSLFVLDAFIVRELNNQIDVSHNRLLEAFNSKENQAGKRRNLIFGHVILCIAKADILNQNIQNAANKISWAAIAQKHGNDFVDQNPRERQVISRLMSFSQDNATALGRVCNAAINPGGTYDPRVFAVDIISGEAYLDSQYLYQDGINSR